MRLINRKSIVTSVVTLVMSGCGGGDGDNASTSKPLPTESVTALNGLATAKVNNATTIDFAPYVMGKGAQLATITSSDPERCLVDNQSGLGANVTMTQAGRCDYVYTVSNAQGEESSAEMVVVSSSLADPVLTPVSVAASIEQPNVVINLKGLLGDEIPDGYVLSDNFVIQAAQGSSEGAVVKSDDLDIRYTAPNVLGWNYIAYTLTNSAGEALIGHVFVSIADEINTPPVINPQEFVYPKSVMINELVTIDLGQIDIFTKKENSYISMQNHKTLLDITVNECKQACIDETDFVCKSVDYTKSNNKCDLSYATGPLVTGDKRYDHYKRDYFGKNLKITDDSGSWQLSNVRAIGATVEPVDPNDVNNKSFTFKATKLGSYDVAYIVSDHAGGSTMGVIRFNVDNVDITPEKNWNDITDASLVFTAPLIHSEATAFGNGQYFVDNIGENNYQVSRWSTTNGPQYCESIGGRLPTESELVAMAKSTNSSVVTERNKWPKAQPYLTTNSGYRLVSLKDGATLDYSAGLEAYVTCVEFGSKLTVEPKYTNDGINSTGDSVIAGKDLVIKAILTSKKGLPLEGIYILPRTADDSGRVICEQATDEFGKTECHYTNTVAGEHPIIFRADQNFGNDNASVTLPINVTPDISSLQINLLSNGYVYGQGKISVSKTDQYLNEVQGLSAVVNSSTPWKLDGNPNGVEVQYPSNGKKDLLIENNDWSSTAQLTVRAIGLGSDVVEPKVMGLLSGTRIYNINNVKYTSTPSELVLKSLKLSFSNGVVENGSQGPKDFIGGLMNYSQTDDWCNKLNELNVDGRNDWRIPNDTYFNLLNDHAGDMFTADDWAKSSLYWSLVRILINGRDTRIGFNLGNYVTTAYGEDGGLFASCVSGYSDNPEGLPIVSNLWNYGLSTKLVTSTPSVQYLDAIKYTNYQSSELENGSYGPQGFRGALFTWNAAHQWCNKLSEINYKGKDNWRMPTEDEFFELIYQQQNMFMSERWPTYHRYWVTSKDGVRMSVSARTGEVTRPEGAEYSEYSACISD